MKPNIMQITVAMFTGLIAVITTVFFCLFGLWKIYIDVPLLLVLSNIAIGALSSLTTLLVGRTVSQLTASAGEGTPVTVTNLPSDPVPVQAQPNDQTK